MTSMGSSDAAARERALDPSCSFIVQAPAGSGKTELLTQRYLRLLSIVEQPEQIVAITFTRKAAAEMRNRILSALQAAAGSAPRAPHQRKTWELARAVRAADAARAWQLLEQPSRLRIQTIDALNASLARRLPVLSGTGAALEPAQDAWPLYEAAAVRLIERLGDGSPEAAALEALIVHLGNRVDRLVGLLQDLLAKREQWLYPIVSAGSQEGLRELLEGTLTRVIERHLSELCAGLDGALGQGQREELWRLTAHAARNLLQDEALSPARRSVLEICERHAQTPGGEHHCLAAWVAVAEVFLGHTGQLYRSVTVRQGFPPQDKHSKARMQRMLAMLAEAPELCAQLAAVRYLPQPVYTQAQWHILQAVLRVLPVAVAELQLVFQAQGQADYTESALRALQALGPADDPTDLALAFDYRLQHLLVDEFQDTSYAQLELLERLTAGWSEGDGRTLFCVGDPMQSIYRFRQAEVGLFLQLQRVGLHHLRLEPLHLSANFRSTRPIVEWVNRVFPAVLSPQDDPERAAVKYSPSIAASSSQAGAVRVHAALEADELAEARRIVQIVRETRRRDPQASIAVLVTARTHVGSIASELTSAGVEIQAIEIEQLRRRPIVQDLIALTRALVHLADRTAWLAVLRAPWCGLTLADLYVLAGEHPKATIAQRLAVVLGEADAQEACSQNDGGGNARVEHSGQGARELSADGRARLARVYPVLRAALQARGRQPLREWVERTWNALGGPATLQRAQDLDDAEAYFQRLEQIEAAGDLEDSARLEQQLEQLYARPRNVREGAAQVEVMTIHKAKGLEFDVVILPSLHRTTRGEDHELLRWTRIAQFEQGASSGAREDLAGARPAQPADAAGHFAAHSAGGQVSASAGIVFAPLRAQGADADPMYRWIELLERERSARERARLLYVAATRARRELHLLGAAQVQEGEEGPQLLDPRQGSMLRMLWHELRPQYEAQLLAPRAQDLPLAGADSSAYLLRLPADWQAPAADAPIPGRVSPVDDLEAHARPEFDWVGETSRHVGTLVHRELERLVRRCALEPSDATDWSPSPARLQAELQELGVPPDRCAVAIERVVEAVQRTLRDERGRWLLGLSGRIEEAESELALSGVLGGRLVSGIIDRSFVDAQGVRWVVDFKTSTHEGGGLRAFLDAEVERYREQLRRYAQLMKLYRPTQPVRAALYFPLLEQWREVDLEATPEPLEHDEEAGIEG